MQPTPPLPSPPRPNPRRRAAYVTLAIALLLILLSLSLWTRQAGLFSYWTTPADWRGADVTSTTLEQTGWRKYLEGGNWRNLPFDPSPAELHDLGLCQHLAMRQGVTIDGVNQFADDTTGTQLQSILHARPTLFYGSYALAKWYAAHGDAAKSDALMTRAYADAPIILVQRYQYPDGRPAAGLHVQHFGIECNRVKKHALDPSLKLTYWDLTTDDKGCIYLLTYDTVYRTDSTSFPNDLPTTYPPLGWFSVHGKVGLLPTATVTP